MRSLWQGQQLGPHPVLLITKKLRQDAHYKSHFLKGNCTDTTLPHCKRVGAHPRRPSVILMTEMTSSSISQPMSSAPTCHPHPWPLVLTPCQASAPPPPSFPLGYFSVSFPRALAERRVKVSPAPALRPPAPQSLPLRCPRRVQGVRVGDSRALCNLGVTQLVSAEGPPLGWLMGGFS